MKLLVISDVHGNLEALQAVLENVEHDEVIFLGDAVNFGPNPKECLDILFEKAPTMVRGNHDNAVAYNIECGCFEDIAEMANKTRDHSLRILDDETVEKLKEIPIERTYKVDEEKVIYLVHAAPSDYLYQYLFEESSQDLFVEEFKGIKGEIILLGHTHIPMILKDVVEGKVLVNPGSVGQPRDGDPRASCITIEDDNIEIHRVEYDIDAVAKKIQEADLPTQLVDILRAGKVSG